MITEDYVSFETAKLLKEKGFDGYCFAFHKEQDKYETYLNSVHFAPTLINNEYLLDTSIIICPTLQMAMKWLREVHNYNISICLDSYVEPYDNQYYIVIRRRKDKYEDISPCEQVYFDSYEQACEAAIKYCLENLI